jgi:hypothetical protein
LPDEDEGGEDERNLVEEAIYVETLMGWDGDPCDCLDCACERFRDGGDDALCPECRLGDHWPAGE